jgi:hypothetical protein
MRDSFEDQDAEEEQQKSDEDEDNIPLDLLKSSSKDPFAGFESVSIHHGDR